jgi:hypothetical protein
MRLLDYVAERLDSVAEPYAVVGSLALAVHGISRSTVGQDVLTTAVRTLQAKFWISAPDGTHIDARAGDELDPLAGIVRFARTGDRDLHLIVGRPGWMDGVLARRTSVPLPGRDLYVVGVSDLILLKLYAGGMQDRWDIAQLLALVPTPAVREDVESRLHALPPECSHLWEQLVSG